MSARGCLVASVIVAAAIAFVARDVSAQTNTGDIEGAVHDALGGAIPGATVEITLVASGFRISGQALSDVGRGFSILSH